MLPDVKVPLHAEIKYIIKLKKTRKQQQQEQQQQEKKRHFFEKYKEVV